MNKTKGFKRLRMIATTLALVFMSSSYAFAAPNENSAKAFDQKVISKISADRALEHIRYLSEEIGPRVAGTNEEIRAREYIKNQFEKHGYEAEIQEFDISNVVINLTIDSLSNKDIRGNAATGSGYTTENGLTTAIVDCAFGVTSSDFPESVMGNIALIKRGNGSFEEKAVNAVAAGASGVIIYNNIDEPLNATLGDYVSPIPVLTISKADGELLLNEMKDKEVIATINAELKTKSWNVIAKREPKNKNKATDGIVYVTSHLDSVPYAPGANDNASGTGMLLEFARALKSFPIDKEVRFVVCGAEEIGLIGSKYYVSTLSQDEIARSVANFNMDMIATSYGPCTTLYASTVDGKSNLVTDSAIEAAARLNNNIVRVNYSKSSDHAPFGDAGIPAAGFIWGDDEAKLEPWYHTPQDTIAENISVERLEQAGEIVGAALYSAIRVQTPNLVNKPTNFNIMNQVYDLGIAQ
ncbi:M28 family peptidase [uncultured Clostridium sp.]|uniref:M28 family peptidase n=1 Tax=uncultured Clostridium sp. TaxID=59620 RepID=UPI0028E48B46|nr:M28 family peptidase [uncultured Clostridium sp.]